MDVGVHGRTMLLQTLNLKVPGSIPGRLTISIQPFRQISLVGDDRRMRLGRVWMRRLVVEDTIRLQKVATLAAVAIVVVTFVNIWFGSRIIVEPIITPVIDSPAGVTPCCPRTAGPGNSAIQLSRIGRWLLRPPQIIPQEPRKQLGRPPEAAGGSRSQRIAAA